MWRGTDCCVAQARSRAARGHATKPFKIFSKVLVPRDQAVRVIAGTIQPSCIGTEKALDEEPPNPCMYGIAKELGQLGSAAQNKHDDTDGNVTRFARLGNYHTVAARPSKSCSGEHHVAAPVGYRHLDRIARKPAGQPILQRISRYGKLGRGPTCKRRWAIDHRLTCQPPVVGRPKVL